MLPCWMASGIASDGTRVRTSRAEDTRRRMREMGIAEQRGHGGGTHRQEFQAAARNTLPERHSVGHRAEKPRSVRSAVSRQFDVCKPGSSGPRTGRMRKWTSEGWTRPRSIGPVIVTAGEPAHQAPVSVSGCRFYDFREDRNRRRKTGASAGRHKSQIAVDASRPAGSMRMFGRTCIIKRIRSVSSLPVNSSHGVSTKRSLW